MGDLSQNNSVPAATHTKRRLIRAIKKWMQPVRVWLKRLIRACHRVVAALWTVIRPLRFNIVLLAVLTLGVVIPDQVADLLLGFAQEGGWLSHRGFFLAAYLQAVCAVFWLTSETALFSRVTRPTAVWLTWVRHIVPVLLGVWPALILALASWRVWFKLGDKEPTPDLAELQRLMMWAGLGSVATAGFAIALLVMLAAACAKYNAEAAAKPENEHRPNWLLRLFAASVNLVGGFLLPKQLRANPSIRYGVGMVMMVLAIAAFAGLLSPRGPALIGPFAVLFISAAAWSVLFWAFSQALGRVRVPAITTGLLLFLGVGLTDCNDNHSISNRVVGPGPTTLPSASQAMEQWLATRPDYVVGQPYPVFIVAAEGGGIRNAYWTASVLASIRDQVPQFNDHLFAICGVSGGSVGGATYAAAIRAESDAAKLRPLVQGILAEDLLSATIARGAMVDAPQQFIPFAIPYIGDRARALEQALELAWEKHATAVSGLNKLRNPFERGFYALREEHPSVPHLVLVTTEVASGERVPVTHFQVDTQVPGSMKVFHDVMQEDIRLSTAAFMSARFPIVTPAATVNLGDGKKHRYVDGGYYENSAAATVQDLIRELLASPSGRTTIDRNGTPIEVSIEDARLLVIVIDYEDPFSPMDGRGSHSFGDPMSPLRALLSTRESRARYSRDQLDRFLGEVCMQFPRVDAIPIRFKALDGLAQLPLGWSLSKASRATMNAQLPCLTPLTTPTENDDGVRFIRDVLAGW